MVPVGIGGIVSVVRHLHDEIAVVGWACRLPGANSVEQLWSLLLEGKCAVSRVPDNRFQTDFFQHPRRQERGRSVTFAAGVIDDIWGFDPAVFGIAPREAVQMDPQQRILLQLTWEALEDAGIPPSSIAGSDVGVYVGASLVEYATAIHGDPSIADAQFAPGNTLSTISNRISYIFNLHGPSITIDTACSSSLVALHQAMEALRSGRIDTAIVGGINIIASPYTFISFSQASMLSPTGLSRAFSADADGFVRAEGGAVLVLRRSAHGNVDRNPCHAVLVASDVNSDGRTNGISLPSAASQKALLERVYSRAGINPQNLAFMEAHGTGTPVGDPIEAMAIGEGVARARTSPLPIGSIKTNIGHLEAASGMAGIMKTMLALQHGVLPKSLHFDRPNQNIDFEGLNLRVCDQPLLLKTEAGQYAGVSSFGFGGTNAHIVVAPGRKPKQAAKPNLANGNSVFAISAASKTALAALARDYAERIHGLPQDGIGDLSGAAAHRRERLPYRAVISTLHKPEMLDALQALSRDAAHAHLTVGEAVGSDLPVAFVYSGNGSQWHGMGRGAYRQSKVFCEHFDRIDSHFIALAGWSLKSALLDDKTEPRLQFTNVAQPLIFAIQSAATAALRARGIIPSAVLGHSVGEVAAAEAAGILDLHTAVKVIYFRSGHQETVRGKGKMVALIAQPERAAEIIARFDDLEIAAYNSPNAVTVAGPIEAIDALQQAARKERIAVLDLDLEYPFHTKAMEPIRDGLLRDLSDISARSSAVPFVSAVSGVCIPGERLNGSYWWQNIREPVRFRDAVREAAKVGARCFVEIGPRGLLGKHVTDCLEGETERFTTLNVLDRNEPQADPFARTVARALVNGVRVDDIAVIPADPGPSVTLPAYPWQQETFRFEHTAEAFGFVESEKHPFRNFRMTGDGVEWRCFLDTDLMPELGDHRVGGQTIFPGTAFLELAFVAAREFLQSDKISISHFEILRPLDLTGSKTREVMTRISPGSHTVEILSRPRLANSAWQMHCRGKIVHGSSAHSPVLPPKSEKGGLINANRIYELADSNGLHYGPAFRVVRTIRNAKDREIRVDLTPSNNAPEFLLDPMRLDACFHGMISLFPGLNTIERGVTYIPVRLDKATLHSAKGVPASASIHVLARNERSLLMHFEVFDAEGRMLATLSGVRAQAIQVRRITNFESVAMIERRKPVSGTLAGRTGIALEPSAIVTEAFASGAILREPRQSEAHLLLEGWATVTAHQIISAIPENQRLDLESLAVSGRIDPQSVAWLLTLLRRLASVGLAEFSGSHWKLLRDDKLPTSESLVREISEHHPELAAELLITGEVTGRVRNFLENETVSADGLLSAPTREFYRVSNVTLKSAAENVAARVRFLLEAQREDRTLRILQVGHNTLTSRLAELFKKFQVEHAIFEPNDAIFEEAKLDLLLHPEIELLGRAATLKPESFDLIVSAYGLTSLQREQLLGTFNHALTPKGIVLTVEPRPAFIHDLLAGADLADRKNLADSAIGSVRGAKTWMETLKTAGFQDASVHLVDCMTDAGLFVIAGKGVVQATGAQPATAAIPVALILPGDSESSLSKNLKRELQKSQEVAIVPKTAKLGDTEIQGAVLIHCPAKAEAGPTQKLAARCLALKAALDQIGNSKLPVWIVFSGALESKSGDIDPGEAGAWAFARVAANEYAALDIRRVDIAQGTSPQEAASRLCALFASKTDETEIQIDANGARAVRIEYASQVLTSGVKSSARAQLQKQQHSAKRVAWTAISRVEPKPQEVEIKVAATGLNFRDLMWSLGLLPDDILEDGYTGPTLGLECAGEVTQAGSSVSELKIGDRVVTFAPSAFSTHVTLPASQVLKIPSSMTFEAAATIPVAFLTAYYGLISLAKLKRNEWVLIHAAAGGVGMAAIQMARTCGARIIATAGSKAKRDMLRAMGIEHVLDSRSNSFLDGVLTITGSGADVVLNSLAGEAMELSIECLSPFGRFVEIGKRDYVGNTHIGLRPFRKNLSYFGVDVDQLLSRNRNSASRLFRNMMSFFEQGTYRALPYSVFPADDIARAFQLMQKSRHIGKIVVTPPPLQDVKAAASPFKVNSKGTHLITGAFGGFGLETAEWLADRGARHLVMIGRKGAASEEAKAALAKLKKRGVKILEAALDASDCAALETFLANISKSMPPVCGVIHAAMVLDDAVIANLNAERFERVLAPKVEGANHLDRLTRSLPLEYFVLFSSVTTLIGNPGQGNYVAANAYMEAVARRRRKLGLQALAVGWGPITDVGVFARNERLQASLSKLRKVKGMTAREALDHMATAIEQSRLSAELSVITIAPYDRSMARDRLKLLRSPTFKIFAQAAAEMAEGGAEIDLHALLQTEAIESVRVKVANVIVSHIAKVLRFRETDISRSRPLGEMGLDSLMALELALNIENSFNIQAPFSGSTSELTVTKIADEIIAQASGEVAATTGNAPAVLAAKHMAEPDRSQIEMIETIANAPRRQTRLFS